MFQAETHDAYWKMPGQKYSDWVPKVRLNVFYDWKAALPYELCQPTSQEKVFMQNKGEKREHD